MKAAYIFVLLSVLTGCGHDNNPPLEENEPLVEKSEDMSGTWRHTQVHEYYSVETNEYLYSDFIETTLVINEDSEEVRYSECWEYGKDSHIAIKTEENFSINYGDTVFTLNDDGRYSTQEENNIQYSGMTSTYFNRYFMLEKISSDVLTDKGLLVLSGPVEVTEYNHVCLWQMYSNADDERIYELQVPYDDSWLDVRINLMSTPGAGEIEYTPYTSGASLYSFSISSNATNFWNIVGSNTLSIDTAIINIIESTDNILSGTYSFVVNNNESYSGEFQMELKN